MKVTLVKIGSTDRPATQEDIDAVAESWKKSINEVNWALVLPHTTKIKKYKLSKREKLIMRVGNEDKPASDSDLKGMVKELKKQKGKSTVIVAHHAIKAKIIKLK